MYYCCEFKLEFLKREIAFNKSKRINYFSPLLLHEREREKERERERRERRERDRERGEKGGERERERGREGDMGVALLI